MAKVSIIIPGRCEPYFQKTIDSVLTSATGDIEVIAIVDGPGQDPQIYSDDPRVRIYNVEKSIGQREAYNLGVTMSTGQIVGKIDAHALFCKGFDEELQVHFPDNAIVLPEMRVLDVKKWKDKPRKRTHFMAIGLDLYCHYWYDYKKRPEAQVEYPEVMTGQGSCWFCTREWNDYIGLLDPRVGSWGNVGIEISLRTWLCGGTQIVNKKVWQAHWFRRSEGGFTYPMDGRKVAKAHNFTRENYYFNDHAFENQVRPFKWIIEKFTPVPGWEAYMIDNFTQPRVILYYTDSKLDETNPQLAMAVRKQLKKAAGPIPIISVSQKPLNFGKNICIGEQPRRYRSVYDAIKCGLEHISDDSIVYLCEHDVFYHPSHFAQLPEKNTMYFNTERWYYMKGRPDFAKARGKRALSQSVSYRPALLKHVEERLATIVGDGDLVLRWEEFENESSVRYVNFKSERPNVDILHDNNYTPKGDYKKAYMKGDLEKYKSITNLPGWGGVTHFQSKTGYAETVVELGTSDFLQKKFRRWLPQISPIRLPKYKRTDFGQLFKMLGFTVGAEVGVRDGKFSETFCKAIPGLKLYCVDLWWEYDKCNAEKAEEHYQTARRRLDPYGVIFVREPSMRAVQTFDDNSLDFVYIDANHDFDFVIQDIVEWSKKVRPGGIICGHDYYRTRGMGVVPAVDAYTYAHNIQQWFITDEKEASFFWVKET